MALALALCLTAAGCAGRNQRPVLEGHYIWGVEVNTFQPCGSDLIYWVDAADTLQFHLTREHERLTSEPYEAVFVRLSGSVGEVPSLYRDTFPGDYDGMITIDRLDEIRAATPDDC